MPPLVVPDAVRVNLIWTMGGVDHMVNVLHYNVGGVIAIGQATADDLAADVLAAYNASNLSTYQANDFVLNRITVRDLRQANQPEFSADVNSGGVSAGDPLPLATSLVVTLRTNLAGRRYRGRTYLGGWSEDANGSLGQALPGAVTAAEAFMTDMMSHSVLTNTWNLGVLSTVLNEIRNVTSVACRDNIWDSQRRRAVPGI